MKMMLLQPLPLLLLLLAAGCQLLAQHAAAASLTAMAS